MPTDQAVPHPCDDRIVVVSGLPRSGTSMMMRMLEAGGLRPLSDGRRAADDDNPKGYFELERVKDLAVDTSWIDDARGKCIKVVSALLAHLPTQETYDIVFMRRELREVVASQRVMLERRSKTSNAEEDTRMVGLFDKHLAKVYEQLEARRNVRVIFVDHRDAIKSPTSIAAMVDAFLGRRLDTGAMARAVDSSLYRQRA